jgi:hypothetical protein
VNGRRRGSPEQEIHLFLKGTGEAAHSQSSDSFLSGGNSLRFRKRSHFMGIPSESVSLDPVEVCGISAFLEARILAEAIQIPRLP